MTPLALSRHGAFSGAPRGKRRAWPSTPRSPSAASRTATFAPGPSDSSPAASDGRHARAENDHGSQGPPQGTKTAPRKGRRKSAAAVAPLTANAVPAIAHHGPVVRSCRPFAAIRPSHSARDRKPAGAQADLQRQGGQHTAGDGAQHRSSMCERLSYARSDPGMPAILGRDGSNTVMPGLNPGITRTVAGAARPTDRVSRGARPARCRCRRRCRRSRSRRRWWRRGGRCRLRSCRRC